MTNKEITLEQKLKLIHDSVELSGRLAEKLTEAIDSDEEKACNKARSLINAYNSNDKDLMLTALCGWSLKSLVSQTLKIKAHVEKGELVFCHSCNELMLLHKDAVDCPECENEDCIEWFSQSEDKSGQTASIRELTAKGYEVERKTPKNEYDFDFLVLSRSKDKEDLKVIIETRTDLKVISIAEEDLSDKDKDGYKQTDRSLLVDLDSGNKENPCMATLYYYIDRKGQIVIIETAFDWG